MCEIVEYASMRLMLVCMMAARLPTTSEATASRFSISTQSALMPPRPVTRIRKANTAAAIFGAVPTSVATAVLAP